MSGIVEWIKNSKGKVVSLRRKISYKNLTKCCKVKDSYSKHQLHIDRFYVAYLFSSLWATAIFTGGKKWDLPMGESGEQKKGKETQKK